jgi:hypothetical protein
MSLSPENRALVGDALPGWGDRDLDAAYLALPAMTLNRLLNKARAEGAAHPQADVRELVEEARQGLRNYAYGPGASMVSRLIAAVSPPPEGEAP